MQPARVTFGACGGRQPPPRPPGYAPIGAVLPALPPNCHWRPFLRSYDCGTQWLAPNNGANGVFYRVIPPP